MLRTTELTAWSFMAFVMAAFLFASAGVAAASSTVSEIFPMETRALAIAFFYALGTAVGGIAGPLLFGEFVHSRSVDQVATGFLIAAAAMAYGGLVELRYGVRAEGRSLDAASHRFRPGPYQAGAYYTPQHENGGPRESQAVG
jgi:MFS family permease